MRPDQLKTWRWRDSVGQFLLIVVGVLVALTADSVRERHAERLRVDAYLHDLRSDLENTLAVVDRAIAFDSMHVDRTRQMVTYLRSADEAPVDSIRRWRGLYWAGLVVVTGTIRTLSETGDVRLLSADVRRSMATYSTDVQNAEREVALAAAELRVTSRIILEREEAYTRWGALDTINGRSYALDSRGMLTDPALRAAYTSGLNWSQYHLDRLIDLRDVAVGFGEVLGVSPLSAAPNGGAP
jgi:hypothetical protein